MLLLLNVHPSASAALIISSACYDLSFTVETGSDQSSVSTGEYNRVREVVGNTLMQWPGPDGRIFFQRLSDIDESSNQWESQEGWEGSATVGWGLK